MESGVRTAVEGKLEKLLARYAKRPDTNEISFGVSHPDSGFHFTWRQDGARRHYFLASATKLATAAVVMQLRHEGRLDLDDAAAQYLEPGELDGVHIHRGRDYALQVTVRELLAHTSGIGDYFEQRAADGSVLGRDILTTDRAWTYEEALKRTRSTPAKFMPSGRPGRAHYSDTNYQILGRLIERITDRSYQQCLQERIIEPLELADTYLFTEQTLGRYPEIAGMLNGSRPVSIPAAMASFKADGGLVSTTEDSLALLRAFMDGRLFPGEYLAEMTAPWNRIFPPLRYGMGIMRFALPRVLSPVRRIPEMVGHSGASGVVLFYVPSLKLYVSGTVNQIRKRSMPFQLMTRAVLACEDGLR